MNHMEICVQNNKNKMSIIQNLSFQKPINIHMKGIIISLRYDERNILFFLLVLYKLVFIVH